MIRFHLNSGATCNIITHKTKDRVTRTPLRHGVNSGAPEGLAVPAPPVMLIKLQTR
jgi:hypothetical protein